MMTAACSNTNAEVNGFLHQHSNEVLHLVFMLAEIMWVELHVVLFSAIHRGENRLSSCLFSR